SSVSPSGPRSFATDETRRRRRRTPRAIQLHSRGAGGGSGVRAGGGRRPGRRSVPGFGSRVERAKAVIVSHATRDASRPSRLEDPPGGTRGLWPTLGSVLEQHSIAYARNVEVM